MHLQPLIGEANCSAEERECIPLIAICVSSLFQDSFAENLFTRVMQQIKGNTRLPKDWSGVQQLALVAKEFTQKVVDKAPGAATDGLAACRSVRRGLRSFGLNIS